jgi:hypothetical protein
MFVPYQRIQKCRGWIRGEIRFGTRRTRDIDITLQLEAILKIEKREHLLVNFLNEGVDDAVLGYLTDTDLKDLGVARIGDRRRPVVPRRGGPLRLLAARLAAPG